MKSKQAISMHRIVAKPFDKTGAGSYVAIGASHGFVLVFDGSQTLKYSLGGHSFGRECGSVSCLAFDHR